MRTGIALWTHLWRNAVPCNEALVMADAQEDQGFDRSADGTRYADGDGQEEDGGFGDGSGIGTEGGPGDGYGPEEGYGDGNGTGDGTGVIEGIGEGDEWYGGLFIGDGEGDGDGRGDKIGSGIEDFSIRWNSGTPYPFLAEAQEIPCEPE